jgi:hypothetical protein
MRLTALAITALITAALALPASSDEEDARSLVKGSDPGQYELISIGRETMTIADDGEIRLSGRPNGYFATKEPFHNYVLTFEWMYERPDGLGSDDAFDGNSGVLIHIVGQHKVWPQCVEVQLANKDAGHIFAINGSKFAGKTDKEAQKKAIKPVGQWNREEITCKDGSITCTINGVEVCRGAGASPDRGSIGWQSEGRPIRFRNLKIKTLAD